MVFGYVGYALCIVAYFTWGVSFNVPEVYKGTPADPHTFLSAGEWSAHVAMVRLRAVVFFLKSPLIWLALVGLIWTPAGKELQSRIKQKFPEKIHVPIFALFVLTIAQIISLPFRFAQYRLAFREVLNVQSFFEWFTDFWLGFVVNALLLVFLVTFVFILIKRFRYWWLILWTFVTPLAIAYVLIQPVWIEPLFYETTPLEGTPIAHEIRSFANRHDIGVEHLYEMNRSSTSTALNAFVYGIGDSARIVVWDNTLKALPLQAVLYITAHEFGHFQDKHFYLGLASVILFMFPVLYIVHRCIHWFAHKAGHLSLTDARTVPFLLLIVSIMMFLSSPLQQGVSRGMEYEADRFALEASSEPEAGIAAYQAIAKRNFSTAYPPPWVQFWTASHPPIVERIYRIWRYLETSRSSVP
ncbi:M48 family metalloprotease [Bacillaceae bacterium SIJ1]|uniref:M48 family metalloprotease n=1 Tax=Litoribacterium kuwaitense TaxID=1398745 RepID=UPI0013EB769C|nr:M48 family metalloprotease [Litoribacterium kuwaitense]NGP44491.1 M48 family metalloprotease [Litoribacterium kuwaitense]